MLTTRPDWNAVRLYLQQRQQRCRRRVDRPGQAGQLARGCGADAESWRHRHMAALGTSRPRLAQEHAAGAATARPPVCAAELWASQRHQHPRRGADVVAEEQAADLQARAGHGAGCCCCCCCGGGCRAATGRLPSIASLGAAAEPAGTAGTAGRACTAAAAGSKPGAGGRGSGRASLRRLGTYRRKQEAGPGGGPVDHVRVHRGIRQAGAAAAGRRALRDQGAALARPQRATTRGAAAARAWASRWPSLPARRAPPARSPPAAPSPSCAPPPPWRHFSCGSGCRPASCWRRRSRGRARRGPRGAALLASRVSPSWAAALIA